MTNKVNFHAVTLDFILQDVRINLPTLKQEEDEKLICIYVIITA